MKNYYNYSLNLELDDLIYSIFILDLPYMTLEACKFVLCLLLLPATPKHQYRVINCESEWT